MWKAIVERMESEFGGTLSSAMDWAVSAAILIGAAVAAWLLHAAILGVVGRLSSERRPFLRSVLSATSNQTRLALLLVALAIALPTAPLGPQTRDILVRLLGLATICLLGWDAAPMTVGRRQSTVLAVDVDGRSASRSTRVRLHPDAYC